MELLVKDMPAPNFLWCGIQMVVIFYGEPNWKERKSFWRINGIILSESDPLTIKSAGGLIQKVPSHEIHFIQPSRHSLMLSAHQLGMSEQDVADVVAFLKKY